MQLQVVLEDAKKKKRHYVIWQQIPQATAKSKITDLETTLVQLFTRVITEGKVIPVTFSYESSRWCREKWKKMSWINTIFLFSSYLSRRPGTSSNMKQNCTLVDYISLYQLSGTWQISCSTSISARNFLSIIGRRGWI